MSLTAMTRKSGAGLLTKADAVVASLKRFSRLAKGAIDARLLSGPADVAASRRPRLGRRGGGCDAVGARRGSDSNQKKKIVATERLRFFLCNKV